VDPGSYHSLDVPSWDEYFRSTQAHNTVTINGTMTSEATGQSGDQDGSGVLDRVVHRERHVLIQAHRDYPTRDGPHLTHTRKVTFVRPNIYLVKDSITGEGLHFFDLRFHLAPCLLIERRPNLEVRVFFRRSLLRIVPLERDDLDLRLFSGGRRPLNGWCTDWSGKPQPCHTVQYSRFGGPPVVFSTALYLELQPSEKLLDARGLKSLE
jgi:hypothetical protein